MNAVSAALIPVFAVIFIGLLIRLSGLIPKERWPSIDHLCYFVLFPALIIKTLATADLSQTPVLPVAGAMLSTITTMAALLLLIRRPLSTLIHVTPSGFTSLFQGSTRWHGFIALVIINSLYGTSGLITASIGIAAMVPMLNLMNVTVLSTHGEKPEGVPHKLWLMIVQNPLIIACLIGIALNILPVKLPTIVFDTLDLMGRAALGIALLTVGAALRPAHIWEKYRAVLATSIIRLLLMPLMMVFFCGLFGVSGEQLVVAAICAAVPTASSGYLLARQMGGDADLMAAIITFQIVAAAFTLPFVISLTQNLSG